MLAMIASFASPLLVCGLNYGKVLECVIFVALLTFEMESDEVPAMLGEPTQFSLLFLM